MTRARDKASAVVANFASTGIDDNADATAITIDSSENLLVGQSSTTVPGAGNTTAGTSLRGTDGVFISRTTSDTSASALQVNKTTGAGNIINVASGGTTVGTIGARGGDLTIGTGNCGLIFNDGTEIVIPANTTTNAVSDANVDLGYSAGRFKDIYLSGGAYIGGTGSANYLSDYEEGSWTPTVSNSSGYAAQVGRYTKVGRLVTLQFQVQWTQSGTTFGILSGFPFTIDDVSRITIVGREYNSAGFLIQANTQVSTTQSYTLCKADGSSTAVNAQSYGWGAHFSYIT